MWKTILNIKNISILILFSIIAMFIIPIGYSWTYEWIIPAISAIIFFKQKNNIYIRSLCISLICSRFIPFIIYFICPTLDSLHHLLYIGIIIPILVPIIKSYKRNKILTSDFIFLSLISAIVVLNDESDNSILSRNIPFYFMHIFLILYFFQANKETENKSLKIATYIGLIGASIFFIYAATGFVFNYCEHPQNIYDAFWVDTKTLPTTFTFCIKIFNYGWILYYAGFSIAYYFFSLLRESKYALKGICIPPILGFISLGILSASNVSLAYANGYNAIEVFYSPIYMAIYTILGYSFYKLYKLF